MPPIELPTSAAFSMPSASMNSMWAATWSNSSYVVGYESPQPGASTA